MKIAVLVAILLLAGCAHLDNDMRAEGIFIEINPLGRVNVHKSF